MSECGCLIRVWLAVIFICNVNSISCTIAWYQLFVWYCYSLYTIKVILKSKVFYDGLIFVIVQIPNQHSGSPMQ